MNNYEFCVYWILDRVKKDKVEKCIDYISVLDYGCGAGQIIKRLRNYDIDAFGCDVFYEGGDYSQSVDPTLFDTAIIKKMEDNIIPFDNDSFDFVINNQVLEHVANLQNVVSEINRVLKPGGVVLSLFPDKSVWREGHCGIPFLHWFPKKSYLRVYYAAAWRSFGFGYHKENKSVMNWSQYWCDWLDKWTYYRTKQEISFTYDKYFCNLVHIEDYWLKLRFGERRIVAIPVTSLPISIQQLFVRKLGGLVFVADKPLISLDENV